MSKHFTRRLSSWWREIERSMKANFPSVARYGLFVGVPVLVISFLFVSITGDVAANFVKQVWNAFRPLANWIFAVAIKNFGVTAIVLLCLWIGILVGHAYFTTLPPKKLFARKFSEEEISVINETGSHLKDYTIKVIEIDGKICDHDFLPKFMGGWTMVDNTKPKHRPTEDLINGKKITFYLYGIINMIDSEKQLGLHNVELKLNAFDKNNNLVELHIYSEFEVSEKAENKKNGEFEISIKKVET